MTAPLTLHEVVAAAVGADIGLLRPVVVTPKGTGAEDAQVAAHRSDCLRKINSQDRTS
jgi:hypothetical protein